MVKYSRDRLATASDFRIVDLESDRLIDKSWNSDHRLTRFTIEAIAEFTIVRNSVPIMLMP
jgi:hypothetical protein